MNCMPSSILRGAAFSAVGLMGVCWNLAAQDSVYVEDTIRAQVREGLTLAAAAKASVAAFFLANQAAPANPSPPTL